MTSPSATTHSVMSPCNIIPLNSDGSIGSPVADSVTVKRLLRVSLSAASVFDASAAAQFASSGTPRGLDADAVRSNSLEGVAENRVPSLLSPSSSIHTQGSNRSLTIIVSEEGSDRAYLDCVSCFVVAW